MENISFESNNAELEGDDLSVERNYNLVQIDGIESQLFGKNSIFGSSSSFEIRNAEIKGNLNIAEKGAAILCLNCPEFQLSSSSFLDLTSVQGGALYFSQDKSQQDLIYSKYSVKYL